MVVATRILVHECLTSLKRREPPPCGGPSSVRLRCTLSWVYSSRKLGAGGLDAPDRRDERPVTGEQTFFVYDSSIFLRYEDIRRAFHAMVPSMSMLQGVDMSPENWVSHFAMESVPFIMMTRAQRDDDRGLSGGHYHFHVVLAMEINLVYSEPKALVQACLEIFMDTDELCPADQCSICMEGFGLESGGAAAGAMTPVSLPCSHPFHSRCITVWLFKGHTCPVCRHDLRGFVSAPWASEAHKL